MRRGLKRWRSFLVADNHAPPGNVNVNVGNQRAKIIWMNGASTARASGNCQRPHSDAVSFKWTSSAG